MSGRRLVSGSAAPAGIPPPPSFPGRVRADPQAIEPRLRQVPRDGMVGAKLHLGWIVESENGWSPCRRDGHVHKTAEQAAKCWRGKR